MKWSYKRAGVDIAAGDKAVDLITPFAKNTYRPEVLQGVGGFGGAFALDLKRYCNPVLVAGTDGVGTKLKVAFIMGKHDTIGIDCVAMCANDVVVCGAEPLFFLDYFATGRLDPQTVKDVVKGVSEGCKMAGCSLIGGETAEMPGFYDQGEYDLAGFCVGAVDREAVIDGSKIKEGDVIIGMRSSGLHSNGFSLARKVLLEEAGLDLEANMDEFGCTLGEELLRPTIIYVKPILALARKQLVLGAAHITGGGLPGNLPRVLPYGVEVHIDSHAWEVPPVFSLIQRLGSVEKNEMFQTFNMGIGMAVVVRPGNADQVMETCAGLGFSAAVIGEIVQGHGGVKICSKS